MADNVITNPGSGGVPFAADDIGGIYYPRSKIALGADGVNDGDLSSSNPMPGDLKKVGGAAVSTSTGAAGAGTLRVVLADDQPVVAVNTELPAAAALGDGAANPTTPAVGAALEVFNGTTWDRARGDVANGLDVDVTRLPAITGTVTANIGTTNGLALDATLTGGGAKAIACGAAKGATAAADATVSSVDGNHNALDVFIRGGGGGGGGGTSQADRSSFADGSGSATPVAGVYNETGTDPTEDQAAAVRITAKRALHANLRGNDGTEIGTLGAPLRTDPVGTTTQPVSGTVTANLGSALPSGTNNIGDVDVLTLPAITGTVTANAGTGTFGTQDSASLLDNAAFTDGTSRVLPAGYVFDETAGTALTENDVAAARIDSKRAVVGVIEDGSTRGQRAAVSAGGALKVDGSGATQPVSAASLPLPSGASTLSEQQTQTTALQLIDDVVHSGDAAASKYALVGAVFDDVSPGTVTENQAQSLRMTAQRGLHVQLRSGSTEVGTSGAPVRTDPTGTTTQPVSGTVTANAGAGNFTVAQGTAGNLKAQVQGEDAHDGPVTGNPVLAGARASAAAPADVSADGDSVRLWALRSGALAAQITAAGALVGGDATNGLDVDVTRLPPLPAGTNNVGDFDIASAPTGSSSISTQGTAAADAAAVGNPLYVGGKASAAAPSDVSADGDVVPPWYLRSGAQAVQVTAAGALIPGDATNGLAVNVKMIAAGTNNIGDVDVASFAAGALVEVQGDAAHDAAVSGNPVLNGAEARSSLGTAVANGDATRLAADLFGRTMVCQIDPAQAKHANKTFTSTQTGADVITPTSGKKLAVTSVVLGAYGTTAARCILWFGDNADTTFTQDTDQVLVAASFAPSSTSKPGLVYCPATPVFCTTADRELHITTDAGLSVDVTVEYYEF